MTLQPEHSVQISPAIVRVPNILTVPNAITVARTVAAVIAGITALLNRSPELLAGACRTADILGEGPVGGHAGSVEALDRAVAGTAAGTRLADDQADPLTAKL